MWSGWIFPLKMLAMHECSSPSENRMRAWTPLFFGERGGVHGTIRTNAQRKPRIEVSFWGIYCLSCHLKIVFYSDSLYCVEVSTRKPSPATKVFEGQYPKIGKWKKWNFFFRQRHALSRSFDIFVITYRVTSFWPKLINMPLFSMEKTDFHFLNSPVFAYCRLRVTDLEIRILITMWPQSLLRPFTNDFFFPLFWKCMINDFINQYFAWFWAVPQGFCNRLWMFSGQKKCRLPRDRWGSLFFVFFDSETEILN